MLNMNERKQSKIAQMATVVSTEFSSTLEILTESDCCHPRSATAEYVKKSKESHSITTIPTNKQPPFGQNDPFCKGGFCARKMFSVVGGLPFTPFVPCCN